MDVSGTEVLADTLLRLQTDQQALHSRLSVIQYSAKDLDKARLEETPHSLDSLPEVFNAIRCLDKRERIPLVRKSSARQVVAKALSTAEEQFAASQHYLEVRKRRTNEVAIQSVDTFHNAAVLGQSVHTLLKDIEARQKQLQEALNRCQIEVDESQFERLALNMERTSNEAATCENTRERKRWRMAHNTTKYIPGLNVVTYPITKIGLVYRNLKSEALEDQSTAIEEQQHYLTTRIKRLRSEREALNEQHYKSDTLKSQTERLVPQARAFEAESKELHQQASDGLDIAESIMSEFHNIKHTMEQLHDLSDSKEYWRRRNGVLEELKALVQRIDGTGDVMVRELYSASQETRVVLDKAIGQFERPLQFYERGWSSSRSLNRKTEEHGDL